MIQCNCCANKSCNIVRGNAKWPEERKGDFSTKKWCTVWQPPDGMRGSMLESLMANSPEAVYKLLEKFGMRLVEKNYYPYFKIIL